jgi:hypothetical protein
MTRIPTEAEFAALRKRVQVAETELASVSRRAGAAMNLLNRVLVLEQSGVGGGVSDHGALAGLTDNDHTQYLQDAPSDGEQYVREDGVWAAVEIPDAQTGALDAGSASTNFTAADGNLDLGASA